MNKKQLFFNEAIPFLEKKGFKYFKRDDSRGAPMFVAHGAAFLKYVAAGTASGCSMESVC